MFYVLDGRGAIVFDATSEPADATRRALAVRRADARARVRALVRARVQTSGKVSPEREFVESRKRGQVIGYVQQARDGTIERARRQNMR